tara:strand:- start:53 stop:334 length:282 start_codon:yes stop_codon:yes gene_type:complete
MNFLEIVGLIAIAVAGWLTGNVIYTYLIKPTAWYSKFINAIQAPYVVWVMIPKWDKARLERGLEVTEKLKYNPLRNWVRNSIKRRLNNYNFTK